MTMGDLGHPFRLSGGAHQPAHGSMRVSTPAWQHLHNTSALRCKVAAGRAVTGMPRRPAAPSLGVMSKGCGGRTSGPPQAGEEELLAPYPLVQQPYYEGEAILATKHLISVRTWLFQ